MLEVGTHLMQMLLKLDWNSLLSAVIGGFIAGAFSLWAVDKAYKNDLNKGRQQDEELVRGFVFSVKTEIEILWERYHAGAGEQIDALEKGKPLLMYYPVTQEYFTIYNNSSFLVGRIKSDKLRKAIVAAYTNARSLIDNYRLNNDMVHKLEGLILTRQQSGSPNLTDAINAQIKGLTDYAPKIVEQHNRTKEVVQELQSILKEQGFTEK
jgi:hypothetical protein